MCLGVLLMKYEERQQCLKIRERQRKEREILTNTEEYQEFINEPTELHDTKFLMIEGSQYGLLTYQ